MKPLPLTQVLYYLSYRSHRLQPVYWTGRDLHPRPPARTANRIRTGTVQLERLVTWPLVYGSMRLAAGLPGHDSGRHHRTAYYQDGLALRCSGCAFRPVLHTTRPYHGMTANRARY